MMPRIFVVFSLIVSLSIVISGCGSSSDSSLGNDLPDSNPLPSTPTTTPNTPSPPETTQMPNVPEVSSSGLARFESAQALASFLTERNLASQREGAGIPETQGGPPGQAGPSEAATAASTPADGFSLTTLQEVGVDESDVVKNDGTYVYVLRDSEIRIVRIQPVEAIQQVASLPIEGFGTALFLRESMLIVLSATAGELDILEPTMVTDPTRPVDIIVPPDFGRGTTTVTVIDISNRSAPHIERTMTLEGDVINSRLIDGTLHLVLREFLQFFSGTVLPEQLPEILPMFVDSTAMNPSSAQLLIQPTGFYRPTTPTDTTHFPPFSHAFTSIASIKLDNAMAPIDAIAILTTPDTLYVSPLSLYLANATCLGCFSAANPTEMTELHKVALTGDGPRYVASGVVPGHPLDQFSFSEHEGFLRIATTVQPGPSNNLFILNEADGRLATVGRLENIAPGETIQSARFVGDRGFLVTFRQIDPLFTLDVSDPRNPVAVGELKVPGFSTFLLPLSDTELLGFGQDADQNGQTKGLQLSLFDVSNFANPILKHHVTIGEPGTFSEALHNHKAFTYFAAEDVVAFPIHEFQSETGFTFIGLDVYRVNGVTGFDPLGRISTGTINGLIANPRYTRGVFSSNTVYAITPSVVTAAPLHDIEGSMPWTVILETS